MVAMMCKAVQWPEVKPEDGEELHRYSMFITKLHNMPIVLDMQVEVNHAQNMKMVIGNLSYTLRDWWRNLADDIPEERQENYLW